MNALMILETWLPSLRWAVLFQNTQWWYSLYTWYYNNSDYTTIDSDRSILFRIIFVPLLRVHAQSTVDHSMCVHDNRNITGATHIATTRNLTHARDLAPNIKFTRASAIISILIGNLNRHHNILLLLSRLLTSPSVSRTHINMWY